jgi:hypothetical protein
LLLVAQSSSISFLFKSLHLAGLVRKFPIIEMWWADFWLSLSILDSVF